MRAARWIFMTMVGAAGCGHVGYDPIADECFVGSSGPVNSAADNCVTSADQTMGRD